MNDSNKDMTGRYINPSFRALMNPILQLTAADRRTSESRGSFWFTHVLSPLVTRTAQRITKCSGPDHGGAKRHKVHREPRTDKVQGQ